MSDFAGREQAENRLARALGRLGREVQADVTAALGNPPDINALTPELWTDIQSRYTAAVLPQLERVFMDALQQQMEATGFSIDMAVANERAAAWARQYSYELVTKINDNSRRMLQSAVSDFFDRGLSIDDLTARLTSTFGVVRAEAISVTEVTRAVTEGGRSLINDLTQRGAIMIPISNTANDDRVCPLCSPRDQKEITDGQYPPYHVKCRCWTSWKVRITVA